SNNIASRIDTKEPKRLSDSWDIDCSKHSLMPQKAVGATAAVIVKSYDIAFGIDPFHIGQNGSRKNDGVKHTATKEKRMNILAAVFVFAKDVALRIHARQDCETGPRHINGSKCTVA